MKSKREATPIAPPLLPSGAQPTYEELLHFFNESADLLCIVGFDGKFKRLNPAWRRVLGWTPEDLQARPLLDFVHPEDRPATLAEMDKLATGTTSIFFENRYRCKDDSCKWLQWTAGPLRGRKEIYAIARDITRRKLLEEDILGPLDRERECMERELHDGLCQELAGIAALSVALALNLAPVSKAESLAAREIGKLLAEAIRHARDLARGGNPLYLEEIGLVAALAEFCLNTGAMFKITCTFLSEPRPPRLDAHREAHLYRIAQEAVNNAITHGRAKRIEVRHACLNGQGSLVIQDDGVGMAGQLDGHPGIGLHTMAFRARLIGASIEITRRSPRGTVVTCGFSQLKP